VEMSFSGGETKNLRNPLSIPMGRLLLATSSFQRFCMLFQHSGWNLQTVDSSLQACRSVRLPC